MKPPEKMMLSMPSRSASRQNGLTAMHIACRYGHEPVAKMLLDMDVLVKGAIYEPLREASVTSCHFPHSFALGSSEHDAWLQATDTAEAVELATLHTLPSPPPSTLHFLSPPIVYFSNSTFRVFLFRNPS